MLTFEVTVPGGRFTVGQRRELARRLTAERVLAATDEILAATDPAVLDLYESLTGSLVREADAWVAARRPVTVEEPGRYLVNLYVGAWTSEMAGHLIAQATERIREFDAEHGGTGAPRVLTHVLDVGKGRYGLDGEVVTPEEFTTMITEASTRREADAPEGSFVDPTCGMIVAVADAVTLERDGVTHGFCCPGCRGHFAKKYAGTQSGQA